MDLKRNSFYQIKYIRLIVLGNIYHSCNINLSQLDLEIGGGEKFNGGIGFGRVGGTEPI